jgi:hypothetical protein
VVTAHLAGVDQLANIGYLNIASMYGMSLAYGLRPEPGLHLPFCWEQVPMQTGGKKGTISHQNGSAIPSSIKMEAHCSSMQMGLLYYFLICLQKALAWCTPS